MEEPLTEIIEEGLTVAEWLLAAGVLVAGIVAGRIIKALIVRRFGSAAEGASYAANMIGRAAAYAMALAGLIYALGILGVRLGPLLGAIGIGGIALALAAQTILANFIASLLIQTRRPFRRGDQIGSNGFEGIVEGVNLRAVVMHTFDGERVLIPANDVLSAPIVNYTALGMRRTTLTVGVSYSTDLQQAQEHLLTAVRSVDEVLEEPVPEAWVEQFNDSSIDFAVRFWHHPQRALLWEVRSRVAMAIKRQLDRAGISIPFPQLVVGQAAESPEPARRPRRRARASSAERDRRS